MANAFPLFELREHAMPESKEKAIPWNLIIPAIVLVAVFAAWFLLPVKDWLDTFSGWIERLGVWSGASN